MDIRPDEELAARALESWLKATGRSCSWKPGQDPPDLAFTIDGVRWAFEVTGLHQYYESGDGPQSSAAVFNPCHKMIDKLDKEVAGRRGVLYIVRITGPVLEPRLSEIETRIRKYINSRATERLDLNTKGDVVILTMKVSDEKRCHVGLIVGLNPIDMAADGNSMLADVAANVKWTVDRALEEKLPTLKTITDYDRKGLLLYAVYFFADADHVRCTLAGAVPTINDLDAIVLIDREKKVRAVFDPERLFPSDPGA